MITLKGKYARLSDAVMKKSAFSENRDRTLTYLNLVDCDRMLYNFRKTFGLENKCEPLGGWEDPKGLLRGHSTGHFLSALALVYSANDAALLIAENIGGSVENFVKMMNEEARSLGATNSNFVNPNGLPDENHYTTAYDLALITREAMRNPIFREIVSTQRATIPWTGHDYDRVLNNKNRLLSSYPGATGVKTGYTKAAGRCLVFSAERENMALIGVVLNCPDWFDQAEALLDRGFQNWQMVTLLHQNEAIGQLPVERGQKEFITIRASRDIAAPMETDTWPDLVIDLPASLPAGVEKGQIVGSAHLMDGGKIICTIPLYADEASPEQTFRFQLERILSCW